MQSYQRSLLSNFWNFASLLGGWKYLWLHLVLICIFITMSEVGHLFYPPYLRTMSISFSVNGLFISLWTFNWINDLSLCSYRFVDTLYIRGRLALYVLICRYFCLLVIWLLLDLFFLPEKLFWFLQYGSYQSFLPWLLDFVSVKKAFNTKDYKDSSFKFFCIYF